MLIIIAGLIGTGKSTIAKAVAAQLGIPLCSIDEEKERIYRKHPEYQRYIDEGIPFPDELRKQAFDATLEKLRGLTKTHRHAIVEETFHLRSLREEFFADAKKLFGRCIRTLVVADEGKIRERLARRKGQMASIRMYESFKRIFEPFAHVEYRFENTGALEPHLKTYIAFLKDQLKKE